MYEAVHYILKTSIYDLTKDLKRFIETVSRTAIVFGMKIRLTSISFLALVITA